MVEIGEDLLNPERAQECGPNGANERSRSERRLLGGAKVGDNVSHEGLTDCACDVITGGDENSMLQEAIHEDNQELVASIGRKRAHNIDDNVSHGPWDWMVPVIFWWWP